jgi:hypothetical protein
MITTIYRSNVWNVVEDGFIEVDAIGLDQLSN